MKSYLVRSLAAAALASTMLQAAPLLAETVPSPKSVLGQDVASDYYLANYDESLNYFRKLAASSNRIKLVDAGKTTQGREMVYAIISSPENLQKFEHYKEVSRRLGEARDLTDADARKLAHESKVIVHIDGGMHASEVADHQLPIALAHHLLSAKNDAEVAAILDNVILVLWPTLNPDGQNMVVDWYRKNLGTPYETSRMPWLYQEYVGHDNNRDGYMLNMLESQVATRAQQDYAPVIWYSHHQVAPFPARIWMPPFADPVSSNISPNMRIWTNAIGTNMMTRFEKEQKPGAIAQAKFDNWYPGFLDYTHVFRNTISFFTEVSHDSATPKTYKVEEFPKAFRDLKAQIMYPSPWKGGLWRLKDSVDYMMTASMSVLDTATKYREDLLFNRYQAARDTISQYAAEGPYAYVISSGQADMPEAALLAQKMIDHGLKVHQARTAINLGGVTYPAGSWVLLTDQPYARLAVELFEKQKYPDAILDGSGKPVDLPYDVTGWTLPLQMGVRVDTIKTPLDARIKGQLGEIASAALPKSSIVGKGNVFALSRKVNASFVAVNEILSKGGRIGLSTGAVTTDKGAETGAIIVEGISRAALLPILEKQRINATAMAAAPAVNGIAAAKVGLYRPWGANMYDEGWTRWLLEQSNYAPASIYNADMKAGSLSAKFDTIILPDINGPSAEKIAEEQRKKAAAGEKTSTRRPGPIGTLLDGLSSTDVPASYAGGIGDDGAAALKAFVADGGTLIALNNASDAVIDLFDLPVTNILKNAKSTEFFCSGALLEIGLNGASVATAGLPANPVVMFERGPAFEPKPGFNGQILASYAPDKNPLQSGVLLYPEKIQGKAAAMEVAYGKGKIYLYGFKPQWRAQSHGTYKFLYNLLYKQKDDASTPAHH
ncbi:M14 family metallopeptidase [Sphingomonas sp. KC8]|uniref:M14 family metallopeptidase n=1 Tax=Sphingomonas sp. KC8 TaxID=1030157 RepID=UPI0002489C69|nr:M14 metallopeptidase family protein [Sphingomonas sp. KC8]ARS29351.1 hypothetical protein KC8_18940 [Sphingomonas sp. KC8]